MLSLDEIKKPVQGNLLEFERKFRVSMKSPVPLLDTVTGYLYRRKGKQMRPMFVFLSAQVCGEINESTTKLPPSERMERSAAKA